MHRPRLSVLMNSRNATQYLTEAIRSVLWQHETDLELILCEASDGDEGVRIAEAFADERIVIVRDLERKGWAHGVNVSLTRCHGEYVAFMAGDDILHPHCLGRMADCLDATGLGTAVVPVRAIDEHSVPTGRYVRVPEDVRSEPTWARLFERNYIIFGLTRRACLPDPPIDPSIKGVGGDWHLWLRLIERGTGFAYVDEVLFDYRVHSTSLVALEADTRADMQAVLARFDDATISACYRRAGVTDEGVIEAALWIAISRGDLDSALAHAGALAVAHPHDARWRFQVPTLLLLRGGAAEAVPPLRACADATDAPEAWNNLGVALRLAGMEGAEGCFRRALEGLPLYHDARRNLESPGAAWITQRPLRPLDQIVR